MKLSSLFSIVQTIALLVIIYLLFDLKNVESSVQYINDPAGEQNIPSGDETVHSNSLAQKILTNELKKILKEELKQIREEHKQKISEINLDQKAIHQPETYEGNADTLEVLKSQVVALQNQNSVSQLEMERLFSQMGQLNKQQRYELRKLFTQSVNSGQIKLVN